MVLDNFSELVASRYADDQQHIVVGNRVLGVTIASVAMTLLVFVSYHVLCCCSVEAFRIKSRFKV